MMFTLGKFSSLIPVFFLFWGTGYFTPDPKPEGEMKVEPVYIEPIQVEYIEPICITDALIQVESAGKDSAYNASEDAVGCLQIRPIMVREVNRILRKQDKERRFELEDRWDRQLSLEMFHIWREYHHPNSTDEIISRNWNGGPKGYKKESTLKYWRKVKGHMTSY